MRRLLAAAAVVATACVGPLAGRAAANVAPSVVLSSPAAGATVTKVSVAGTAAMPGEFDTTSNLRISVTSKINGVSDGCNGCPAEVSGRTLRFSFTPSLTYNGPYDVTVTADGVTVVDLDGPGTASATTTVRLAVPPASPRSVKAQAGADRVVTVTWARNTEPDLVGYQVQRRDPGGSGFKAVSGVVAQPRSGSTVSWSEPGPGPEAGGAFTYAVLAVRPDGSGDPAKPLPSAPTSVGFELPAVPGAATPATGAVVQPGAGSGAPVPTPGGRPVLDLKSFVPRPVVTPGPSLAVPAAEDNSPVIPTLPYSATGDDAEPGGDGGIIGGALPLGSNQRALVVPVAAGLFLCVAAFHVRLFNRRLA